MSEMDILKSIMQWLECHKVLAWRNNTGAYSTDKGHFVRFGKKGSGDILGVLPGGRFISIEVKQKGKYPSEDQRKFMQEVVDRGGIAFVARSIEDVESKLLRKKK